MIEKISEVPANKEKHSILQSRLFLVIGMMISAMGVLLVLLIVAFNWYQPTSFVAEVQTNHLHFTVHKAVSGGSEVDGGLFAPSRLLNLSIDGCGPPQRLAGTGALPHWANTHVRCDRVRLNTLVYGPDTEVFVDVTTPGLVVILLREKQGSHTIRAVFDSDHSDGTQQWAVEPAHAGLKFYLREAERDALPDETALEVTDRSAVYAGKDDTPFVEKESELRIPRLGKRIKLRDSRLELMNVAHARVRKLSWNRTSGLITSVSTIVTGKSDNIALFSPYTDESANEALNVFDYYTHGRWGHFLAAVLSGSGLVALVSLLVSAAQLMVDAETKFGGLKQGLQWIGTGEGKAQEEDEI